MSWRKQGNELIYGLQQPGTMARKIIGIRAALPPSDLYESIP